MIANNWLYRCDGKRSLGDIKKDFLEDLLVDLLEDLKTLAKIIRP